MAYRNSCNHLTNITNIPISKIIISKEPLVCADCDCHGPNLWICLHKDCLRLGCGESSNNHSTLHNTIEPTHCIQMNVENNNIWCYECRSKVQLNSIKYTEPSNHDPKPTDSDSSDEEFTNFGDKPQGLVGLQNIGNTCYMNAALQALSNTEPLTRFFLCCAPVVHILSEGRKPGLSRTYQTLMNDIWVKRNGGYVTPSGILYGIRSVHAMFRGYHQHDTQEFLRNFMDQLHEELKQSSVIADFGDETFSLAEDSVSYDSSEGEYETCDSGVSERSSLSDDNERPQSAKRRCGSPCRRQRAKVIDSQPCINNLTQTKKPGKYRSIISDIFDGKLLSTVQCLTCDRVSSRVETFQDLSLPIPSRDHVVLLHGRSGSVACSEAVLPVQKDGWMSWFFTWFRSWFYGPTVTLHDCLAAFFSTDELKGDNMYSCEKCNKLRNGVKFSKVLQLPEVLCIHLKRFRHELMFSSKISSAVSFPLNGLDMRPYLRTDCTSKVSSYELFSVICHYGTAGGGHYLCYALNCGEWFEFDDQYVTRVSPEKVQSCEAYVLFYRKSTMMADLARKRMIRQIEDSNEVAKAYVSRQWVNRFYYCAEPGPIDNSDFLCQHGLICPERNKCLEQLAIVLPLDVYDFLLKSYGGCGPITSLHVCAACQALQNRIESEFNRFLEITEEVQRNDLQSTHYLAMSFISQWHNFVHRRCPEPPGAIDNSRIVEGGFDPSEAAEVPQCLWEFYVGIYGGGPEVRIVAPPVDEEQNDFGFVIPSLKAEKKDVLDSSLYSHGDNAEADVVDDNLSGNKVSEDIDEEESNDIRRNRRYRRRRKNVVNA